MQQDVFLNVSDALSQAETVARALRNVYLHNKKLDRKRSLSYYCRRAGISSTGYLSDVISGKRPLSGKYIGPICASFGFSGEQETYFLLIAERESAGEELQIAKLSEEIETIRKVLRINQQEMGLDPRVFYFALELISTTYLFPEGATFEKLLAYYGNERAADLKEGLAFLEKRNLLVVEAGCYRSKSDYNTWIERAGQDLDMRLALNRKMLEETSNQLERYLPNNELAHFESSFISVDADTYRALLPKIRVELKKLRVRLDSPRANLMVRFNVQVFPIQPANSK